MITPAIIGFIPTPVTSFRLVFNPIAAKAIDKKNFDKNDTPATILSGTNPVLLIPTTIRNPRINHGNTLPIFTFSADCDDVFVFEYIHEKISTIGTMKRVLVSLTIVAREPAASEKEYPAATTEDVSLTAVPIQSPYPLSPRPRSRPIQGKAITVIISKIKVADIA